MTTKAGNIPSILVIDSGVGGLSICQSILKSENAINLIYFADGAFFPYGLMDEIQLTQRLNNIVAAMLSLHSPSLVVLACNTISTLVLPELRKKFKVPFVGVVPAIKPAAIQSRTKKIGLLATPATICRPYIDELIESHAADCEVVRVGSNELVLQAENMLSGQVVNMETIAGALATFKTSKSSSIDDNSEIDTIVLGCTHFPLLKEHLSKQMAGIKWVDSGDAVAKRVHNLLDLGRPKSIDSCKQMHQLYFSGALPEKAVFSERLKGLGFGQGFRFNQFQLA